MQTQTNITINETTTFENIEEAIAFLTAKATASLTPTPTPTCCMQGVIQPVMANEAIVPPSPFEVIMGALEYPLYTLRTLKSLQERSGREDVLDILDGAGIEYVTRTKRGSGDVLVGLASRN